MPLFLIPLAFSLLSAGLGVYSQAKTNTQLARAGSQAVDDQAAANEILALNQFATYVAEVDKLNAETEAQAKADAQARINTGNTVTMALYSTTLFLLLLTLIALVSRANRIR